MVMWHDCANNVLRKKSWECSERSRSRRWSCWSRSLTWCPEATTRRRMCASCVKPRRSNCRKRSVQCRKLYMFTSLSWLSLSVCLEHVWGGCCCSGWCWTVWPEQVGVVGLDLCVGVTGVGIAATVGVVGLGLCVGITGVGIAATVGVVGLGLCVGITGVGIAAAVGVVGLCLCMTTVGCCCSGWCCWTVSVCDRSRLLLQWLVVLDCICVWQE